MPRTIAPVLSALLSDLRAKRSGKTAAGDAQVIRQAAAELLGLLAVARAVEREGAPTCGCGPCRAMVRLRRLSNPPRVAGKRHR